MIIKCKECGGDVSDQSVTCPHCGYPMKSDTKTNDCLKINPKSDWTHRQQTKCCNRKSKKRKEAMVSLDYRFSHLCTWIFWWYTRR